MFKKSFDMVEMGQVLHALGKLKEIITIKIEHLIKFHKVHYNLDTRLVLQCSKHGYSSCEAQFAKPQGSRKKPTDGL